MGRKFAAARRGSRLPWSGFVWQSMRHDDT
jgi:hypothetical protein